MSKIDYVCIARDPQLVICEYAGVENDRKTHWKETKALMKEGSLPQNATKKGSTQYVTIYKDIYFGCASGLSYSEEKCLRFLRDLHAEFSEFYGGNIDAVNKQTNLAPNILDKPFRSKILKLLENYNTGISTNLVTQAFAKSKETQGVLEGAIGKMVNQLEDTENLYDTSNEIKALSMDFEKDAGKLRDMAKSRDFWMCSRKCLLIFGLSGLALFGLVIGLYFGLK